MFRSKVFAILFIFSFLLQLPARGQELTEGESMEINGIVLNYQIVNQRSVDVKHEPHDRYEVVVSAKNESGRCVSERLAKYPDYDNAKVPSVATFFCRNATGARLTPKEVALYMDVHRVNVTYQVKNDKGKNENKTLSATAGYYFDNDSSLQEKVIFIVPQGKKPEIMVNLNI